MGGGWLGRPHPHPPGARSAGVPGGPRGQRGARREGRGKNTLLSQTLHRTQLRPLSLFFVSAPPPSGVIKRSPLHTRAGTHTHTHTQVRRGQTSGREQPLDPFTVLSHPLGPPLPPQKAQLFSLRICNNRVGFEKCSAPSFRGRTRRTARPSPPEIKGLRWGVREKLTSFLSPCHPLSLFLSLF